MSYPTSQSEFDHNVAKITPAVQKVSDKVAACQHTASKVHTPPNFWESVGEAALGAVFPIAGIYFAAKQIEFIINNNPAVKQKLDDAAKVTEQVAVEVGRLLSPGNPFMMMVMADNWDAVNTKLTGVVAPLGDDKFHATQTWTDGMGQRYAKVPAGQRAALEGMLPHVDSMRKIMRDHANQIIQLWWDIWMEIFDFEIQAIPLAAKFIQANPLKWLEIAGAIADCIAAVLKAIQKLVSLVFDFTTKSNDQIETLQAASSDVTGTDFGRWPQVSLG